MTVDTPFMERGEIYLREPRESDVDGPWYAWLNDPEVTRYQDKGIFPNTREKQRAYMQSASSSSSDVLLAIVHRETGTHIGNVGLHDIDWVHRSAQLGIMIGSKDFWGRGYGRDVWNMITEYGFDRINLNRIYAWIIKENVPSLKAAEASGYKIVGEVPDYLYKNGVYYSAYYTNVLRDEFKRLE